MPTRDRSFCRTKAAFVLIIFFLVSLNATAMRGESAQNPQGGAGTTEPEQAKAPQTAVQDRTQKTVAQNTDEAWSMLSEAVAADKSLELRTQALAALGTLSNNRHAETLIAEAMKDQNLDIRTAAILAAGQTKNRNLTTEMRNLLDDKEPQVAFIAAMTLWKTMNDRSGEDILMAVVNGDRSATPGLVSGTMHKVSREFHDPASMAKLGALQGASMLLGPFGFGLTAYEYMHKNKSDTARVSAINQLAEEHTTPVREELIAALSDKDLGVRAAAASALGSYPEKTVSDQLLPLFDDTKAPVRLTAAAAYIRSTYARPARKRS